MTASSRSASIFNGVSWRLAGSYFSYVSGGASWLTGMHLFYLSSSTDWNIGTDVTSNIVYAYVTTTSTTPVGTSGWHRYDGRAWSAVDIAIACAPSQPPASPSPPLPPAPPPPCEYLLMTASSGSQWIDYNGVTWRRIGSHSAWQ
jgi:hypothetical protein